MMTLGGHIKTFLTLYIGIQAVLLSPMAVAKVEDGNIFQSQYPTSNTYTNFNCNVCHTNIASSSSRNGFGLAYFSGGKGQASLVALENLDTDGDGESNIAEINQGSNPGSAASTSANIPVPGASGGGSNSTLGSNGGELITDYQNANLLTQTSCGSISSLRNSSINNDGGPTPPSSVVLLMIPLLLIQLLRAQIRIQKV